MEWKLDNNTNVLVIAKPEKCINYRWYENAEKIDSQLQLLPVDYVNSELFPCGINNSNDITEGMMLVRNPNNKTEFIDVTQMEDIILLEKLANMRSIGLKLGAKDIDIHCFLNQCEEREYNVNANPSFWKVSVDTNITENQKKYEHKEYKVSVKGNNTPMTEETYNEAISLAKRYGLDKDPQIKSLLNDRHPSHPANGTFYVSTSAIKEVNRVLDVAVSASYLFSVNLKIDVANSCSIKKEIMLQTTFEF